MPPNHDKKSSLTPEETMDNSPSASWKEEIKSDAIQEQTTAPEQDPQTFQSTQLPPTNPTLPELRFTYRRTYIFLYVLFLFTCNVVIPCILFYPLVGLTKLSKKEVIGISSAALGISSCFDTPARLYRLVRYRRLYGPLGSDTWWHLDFSMWTYTIALFIFAVPLAIAPAIPLFNFFLMSTVMLVGPVGLVFLISLFRPRLPFRCSSDPVGTRMKPAVFYLIEDVASVDFKHGRDYRRALYDRWNSSMPFQRLIMRLTLYWTISATIYCGVTAAVSWTTSLEFAFAWTLGQLFIWAGVSAFGCHVLARKGLRDERKWWAREVERKMDQVDKRNSV
ncbi:hypothetical protein GALMADRAFT_237868 [Galerina marginata CBS 339.88]|uniref:Uncharacterized protein n=1 Tax=Galerina marginata (strain CBS 339.88) TaxID=685588 RepID=A0A067TRK2_GALM3|nr:hypothetical protein GALMADRAFT_237868 [Galerina marginata CBS 339.88]